jgi:hypothetical protein
LPRRRRSMAFVLPMKTLLCEKMMAFRALSNRFAPFKAAMITYSTDMSGFPRWVGGM